MVQNAWDVEKAATLSTGLDELVYRSNLIGSDRAVCNWGGGNTSMKTVEKDFRGREIAVMWVKGSGSDLATMGAKNFTGLNLEDIRPLIEREEMSDEEMVEYLGHCMIDRNHPRPSIETLLHAFLPFKHVDHTHPDAIISICCADNGKEIAKNLFGDRFVWVPYVRPGFSLSKLIAEGVQKNPHAELVLMEKHGLVVWGETAKESYDRTISVINEAEAYIRSRINESVIFGGGKYTALAKEERMSMLANVMPVIRGAVSDEKKMIVTFDDGDDVLEFVNSVDAARLSQVGAACPDHLVHTKMKPLFVKWDPSMNDINQLIAAIKDGISSFKEEYKSYFERNKNEGDVMFEPAPRVILIPGIGMVNTGKNVTMARVSGALYHRAIAVMKGATALGTFVSLNENESYNIEYWPLELYKLSLAPAEAEFSRKVAFVTGGAGGIGSETCRQFVAEGAHVVVADLNLEGAEKVVSEINEQYGTDRALAVKMDVTSEEQVQAAFKQASLTYGGIDIVVNNAGLATSSPFDETTLDEWNLNMNVLGTGYFLVAREAFKQMKVQGTGGNMVFIGSKNSVYAGKNATAYSSAKALETHLARCIAAEGGPFGIRVNSVLPDAVLQGSAIWGSRWRQERATAYGIEPDQLEEHYRKRTTLLVNVYPGDIAAAILFFASSKAEKTTGCMLTVDGGVPAAFTR
ncbi:bifunctional rhamnulose-1-phosphate aldolase/short-chain dehydrogenase [Halalkalibacterium halodurans]|uniref:BH1550 protein n=1 Tax=Halalkalibacterium halodurans (strain ATCC BAA-125 / DSM 18197 / FERM 7344 / JCM 9153 / C-125) TaxID=272558 RepID=Q9KCM1_HALH5|nr:bifunctional rhamnulose-1-phosphate aldolase/short-chain dehydrogenase [Halalkalibacterium halodurans]MDY7222123.1 bifunctional rhamnulose-1-phosphate aldolase/short-chain dehydrogenase [Halalkalibacterium halodurans]MDY7241344.1 bifunctional rhamnulose-1-phosphate aldolase/short-chain dehydrogenase [Halalkalibacterium halodurans]MED4172991.1 bifunctional rhamnulose-1-phosphate aldolase/short-chain dehydrogenase [Halalkalibacterium halodurans]BAB05269.1 BH1550 [Halalkalibacterium halodurans 